MFVQGINTTKWKINKTKQQRQSIIKKTQILIISRAVSEPGRNLINLAFCHYIFDAVLQLNAVVTMH